MNKRCDLRIQLRLIGLLVTIGMLAGTPAALLAQDSSDSATVSVEVIEAPPLLSLSMTYQQTASTVTTNGGTAYGDLVVTVTDDRPVSDGWYVLATMGPFTQGGTAVPALSETYLSMLLIGQQAPNVATAGTATLNAPNILIMYTSVKANGSATWSTVVSFPAGIEPGTYDAVLTTDLYGGDPP